MAQLAMVGAAGAVLAAALAAGCPAAEAGRPGDAARPAEAVQPGEAARPAAGTPADAARPAEPTWEPIFNGKDLAGWAVKCRAPDRDKGFWKVEGGTILADSLGAKGHDYVWLMTEREYGDFALRLKFQAYRDSPGNSGVQVRSRYDEADGGGWLHGPQVDIHPPGPWRTGMIWDETRGNQRWLWPAVAKGEWVNESMARPGRKFHYSTDEPAWNDLEITCAGTRMKAVLNGLVVMEYDGAGVLDDETHAQRRVGLKGHIALQIHKGDQLKIRFKDLHVRNLGK